MTLEQTRALEALALTAGPIKPETIDQAKQLVKLLPLLDDGSEEFAALADLIKALAYKDMSNGK